MKNLKLNNEVEITKEKAIKLLSDDYDFNNLLNSMSVDTQEFNCDFPVIQNARFSIEKIKRAGTIVYDYENWKRKIGGFILRVTYDYKHPSNFALNQSYITKEFRIDI